MGAKTDQRHGRPVTVKGTVRVISDGYFIEPEARHGGARFNNQGVSVRIETEEGHQVILTSLRLAPMSLRQVTSLGVHPQDMKFIVVKGVTAPRAAYEPVCDLVIPVDTPGCTQAGPESFTYYKRPRPLYPLDEVEDWRVVES
ncbi:MAG: MlrC C-terminal domain-containing protein [Candidatus Omnitrophica bacterium]|nr:MlrC C-terminal domain-containing protein [Candidatus Omnitrophota bacterium]